MTKKIKELSLQETMERYPRITANGFIPESLGILVWMVLVCH
jgi:hypothetical protein